jgi:anti-sigma factor RsiW
MTSDPDSVHDLIQGDLDGELSPAGRAELARRLLRDPEARRLHEDLLRTHRLLRDIAHAEPPAGLREAILTTPGPSVRASGAAHRKSGWPAYRIAAAFFGGLLVAGIGYLALDGIAPSKDLQGSMNIAPPEAWSIRGDGVEVGASLRGNGKRFELELDVSSTVPCEVVARIDPAQTSYVGTTGNARLNAASDRVTVLPAPGHQVIVLEFSGEASVQLELRSQGRLLGEGRVPPSPR